MGFMKSKIIFHFFIFLFGFFVGNLFPTFFGHIVGSITSFFLLLILEGFNFIGARSSGGQASGWQGGSRWLRPAVRIAGIRRAAISPPLPSFSKTAPYPLVLVSIFNSLKIGILFGLFVDAFKVGS